MVSMVLKDCQGPSPGSSVADGEGRRGRGCAPETDRPCSGTGSGKRRRLLGSSPAEPGLGGQAEDKVRRDTGSRDQVTGSHPWPPSPLALSLRWPRPMAPALQDQTAAGSHAASQPGLCCQCLSGPDLPLQPALGTAGAATAARPRRHRVRSSGGWKKQNPGGGKSNKEGRKNKEPKNGRSREVTQTRPAGPGREHL